MANYIGTSPWFNTQINNGQYLDVLKIRPIPAETDDVLYTVQVQYTHRPDLLAFDLYGDKTYGGYLLSAIWKLLKILYLI